MSYDYLNIERLMVDPKKMKNGEVDFHSDGNESGGDHRIVYAN